MKHGTLITIYTHNRPEYLAINLMGLRQQTFKAWDLMIVDDASDEPIETNNLITSICRRLKEENHEITFKRFEDNNGIAKNRALILPTIKEWKYVMDLNDDHFMEADCLELLFNYMQEHDDCGAVGTATPFFFDNNWDVKEQYDESVVLNRMEAVEANDRRDIILKRHVDKIFHKDNKPITTPIKMMHISQFMYRPRLLDDDELPQNYSVIGFTEETDLCLRIMKKGYDLYFLPNAVNWHFQASEGGIRDVKGREERTRMIQADFQIFLANWFDWIKNNLGGKTYK